MGVFSLVFSCVASASLLTDAAKSASAGARKKTMKPIAELTGANTCKEGTTAESVAVPSCAFVSSGDLEGPLTSRNARLRR